MIISLLFIFISETAGLLPVKFFKQRYQLSYDVRENLFMKKAKVGKNLLMEPNIPPSLSLQKG